MLAIINGIGILELWMIPLLLIGPFLYNLISPGTPDTSEDHFYTEDKEAIINLKKTFFFTIVIIKSA